MRSVATLLLVRHGETAWNDKGLYLGHTDVPLNKHGLCQAERLKRRLAGVPIVAAFSSDLARSRATAETIAGPRGLHVECVEALREMDFGPLEGLNAGEVGERFPQFYSRVNDGVDEVIPGGESLHQLAGRVGGFLSTLPGVREDAEKVLVVSHGGTLRVMICLLLGLEIRYWWRIRLDLASVTVVETYAEGAVLTLLNDTHHLEECEAAGDCG